MRSGFSSFADRDRGRDGDGDGDGDGVAARATLGIAARRCVCRV